MPYRPAWSINQTTGRLTTTYGLDLGGNSIENVKAIMSASGNWRIGEDGELVVKKVKAEEIEAQNGVTTYDTTTGEPYCIRVTDGVATTVPGQCSSKNKNPAATSAP